MNDVTGDNAIDSESGLRNVRTIGDVLRLMWNQTWPLFVRPNLARMLLLCYLVFMLFFVSHGLYFWYASAITLSIPIQ